ncbi:hypothetical protein AAVH_31833, partial [Aphelenchoides avenae]
MELIDEDDSHETHDPNRPLIVAEPEPGRGGEGLKLYDGEHMFFRDKSSPDGSRIYWRCRFKSKGCFARLHTLADTGEVVHRGCDHNHEPNCLPHADGKKEEPTQSRFSEPSGSRRVTTVRDIIAASSKTPSASGAASSRRSDAGTINASMQAQRTLPHLRSRESLAGQKRTHSPMKKIGHTRLEDALESLSKEKNLAPPPAKQRDTGPTFSASGSSSRPVKSVVPMVSKPPAIPTLTKTLPKERPDSAGTSSSTSSPPTAAENTSQSLSVVKRFLNLPPVLRQVAED